MGYQLSLAIFSAVLGMFQVSIQQNLKTCTVNVQNPNKFGFQTDHNGSVVKSFGFRTAPKTERFDNETIMVCPKSERVRISDVDCASVKMLTKIFIFFHQITSMIRMKTLKVSLMACSSDKLPKHRLTYPGTK